MGTIYTFDTDHAKQYGTNEAVILQNIIFWVKKNKANNKHLHHGKHWTYNSVKAFNELFDFLTTSQVRRCLESLEKQEAIIKSNFNESVYDRTLWYTLSDELYVKYIDNKHLAEMTNGLDENGKTDLAKMTNGHSKNHKPIPYINTDFKHTDKKHTPELVCDETITQLQDDIKKVTGNNIDSKDLARLLTISTPEKIRHHLDNWHIHKQHQRYEGAGWFLTVIKKDIEPIKKHIPQRDNFDQREYSDEEYEKFYADLTGDSYS